ncbi:hypothetical protein E8A73_037900 [Polyangium aurulentum]|nr:hypothetical protein E8A73_037900 [Polyangium aurulentum]
MSPATVCKWRGRFVRDRLAGLSDQRCRPWTSRNRLIWRVQVSTSASALSLLSRCATRAALAALFPATWVSSRSAMISSWGTKASSAGSAGPIRARSSDETIQNGAMRGPA